MKILALLFLTIALTGCTVADSTGRFERIGFPGVFEPSVVIIIDTKTGETFYASNGALAEGAIAAALRRPNRITTSVSSEADANSNGNGHGHGHDK